VEYVHLSLRLRYFYCHHSFLYLFLQSFVFLPVIYMNHYVGRQYDGGKLANSHNLYHSKQFSVILDKYLYFSCAICTTYLGEFLDHFTCAQSRVNTRHAFCLIFRVVVYHLFLNRFHEDLAIFIVIKRKFLSLINYITPAIAAT